MKKDEKVKSSRHMCMFHIIQLRKVDGVSKSSELRKGVVEAKIAEPAQKAPIKLSYLILSHSKRMLTRKRKKITKVYIDAKYVKRTSKA